MWIEEPNDSFSSFMMISDTVTNLTNCWLLRSLVTLMFCYIWFVQNIILCDFRTYHPLILYQENGLELIFFIANMKSNIILLWCLGTYVPIGAKSKFD